MSYSTETIEGIKKVLNALDEVVAEVGNDYVYPEDHKDGSPYCRYVYNGEPDCIAARVLAKLGVPVGYLAQYEDSNCEVMTNNSAGLDVYALNVLRVAQVAQDYGRSWGVARDAAKARASRRYGVTVS